MNKKINQPKTTVVVKTSDRQCKCEKVSGFSVMQWNYNFVRPNPHSVGDNNPSVDSELLH